MYYFLTKCITVKAKRKTNSSYRVSNASVKKIINTNQQPIRSLDTELQSKAKVWFQNIISLILMSYIQN